MKSFLILPLLFLAACSSTPKASTPAVTYECYDIQEEALDKKSCSGTSSYEAERLEFCKDNPTLCEKYPDLFKGDGDPGCTDQE